MTGAVGLLAICLLAQASQSTTPDTVSAATALIRVGNYAAAHQLLISEITKAANDLRLPTLDGYALSRMGRDREALASYESVLKHAPQYLPALEGAAELKFKFRTPDAAELLSKVANLRPSEQPTHLMLATLAFEKDDCHTALAEFGKSEQLISTQAAALEQRGSCLLRLNRGREAIDSFRQVQKLSSGSARSNYNLALSQFQAGLYQDSIATLNSQPASALDADAFDLLADACERIGDTPAAANALRQAIALEPNKPHLYVRFADLCLAHNSFQAGIDMLNAGMRRMPGTASLYLARGILFVQLAQLSAAEEDFNRAEAMEPNSRYAAVLQGMTKLQENQLEHAADDLQERVKKQPQNAYLHYLLAETLIRNAATVGSPEFSQAVSAAKTAVRLQPSLGLARDVLGRLYLQQGNIEGAVEQSRQAFADDPTDQTALYHLIRALKTAGRTNEVAQLTKSFANLRREAESKEADLRRYSIIVNATEK